MDCHAACELQEKKWQKYDVCLMKVFLCLWQHGIVRGIVFGLFVHPSICASQMLLTLSWKVVDVFSSNFQHWYSLGQGRTLQVWGSKGQSSRSWWIQHALLGLVNGMSRKLLDWISPNFQHWCILGQGWILVLQFWGSKVKVTAWPRAQWAEAWRASSSNF